MRRVIHFGEGWHASGYRGGMSVVLRTLSTDREMEERAEEPNQPRPDDTQTLRREVGALRARLNESAGKTKHFSWDTELLVRKTEGFDNRNFISAAQANWRQALEEIVIGPEGVCVSDVRTVDAIEFIASFAARHQLTMTYGNKSFLLEPRCLPE